MVPHAGCAGSFCSRFDRLAEKGSRKKGSQAGDDDSSSIASASTFSSVAELGYDEGSAIEDDPFEVAIDALYEKRCAGTAATSEAGG